MATGNNVGEIVGTINDAIDFLTTTPIFKEQVTASDLKFLNGLKTMFKGSLYLNDVYSGIQNGMSIPKAFVVNCAAQSSGAFSGFVTGECALILMGTPTPATVALGAGFFLPAGMLGIHSRSRQRL